MESILLDYFCGCGGGVLTGTTGVQLQYKSECSKIWAQTATCYRKDRDADPVDRD